MVQNQFLWGWTYTEVFFQISKELGRLLNQRTEPLVYIFSLINVIIFKNALPPTCPHSHLFMPLGQNLQDYICIPNYLFIPPVKLRAFDIFCRFVLSYWSWINFIIRKNFIISAQRGRVILKGHGISQPPVIAFGTGHIWMKPVPRCWCLLSGHSEWHNCIRTAAATAITMLQEVINYC